MVKFRLVKIEKVQMSHFRENNCYTLTIAREPTNFVNLEFGAIYFSHSSMNEGVHHTCFCDFTHKHSHFGLEC